MLVKSKCLLNYRLDLDFLPKDLLYNNKGYGDSQKNLLDAIEILEKAQHQQINIKPKVEEEQGFFSKMFSNFRCGKSD
jgi:hypothetical protein